MILSLISWVGSITPNYARNEVLFKDRFRATKIYCDSDSGLVIENFVVARLLNKHLPQVLIFFPTR